MKFMISKRQIAGYIIGKYKEEEKEEISPIKLQKSLYFIFAEVSSKISQEKLTKLKYLFDARFEAWPYGPVDEDIYIYFIKIMILRA